MKISVQQQRNAEARKGIMFVNEECGLRWNFIASQIGMKYHSFANWRRGLYEFGESRLNKIEALIAKHNINT